MTSTPTLTIERTGAEFKAVVRHSAGVSASYHHKTYTAARVSGERRLAQVLAAQQPQRTGTMSFRVTGAGRLTGR